MAVMITGEDGVMVEPEDIRVQGSDGIWERVSAMMAPDTDDVMKQVWPNPLYLIQNGVIDPAISSLNSSIYFNAANNGISLNQNTASFSRSGENAILSGKGVADTESRSYLVSNGTIYPAGRKKLILECSCSLSSHISAAIGVITDENCRNLLKNTKRIYPNERVDYGFSWKYINFGRNYTTDATIKTHELDISEIASESLHLCMNSAASGVNTYWITIYIKNMYLL